MYTIMSAIGVPKGIFQRWGSIDLATKVKDIYANYRRAHLTLRTPQPYQTVYLDLDAVAAQYFTFDGTIAQMLASAGDRTLPVTTTGLTINQRRATFIDTGAAGLACIAVNAAGIYDPTVRSFDQDHAMLINRTRGVDYARMMKRTLVSVAGLIHKTDTTGSGLIVREAMKSLRISNQCDVGVWSFETVADIKQVALDKTMLNLVDPYKPRIKLPVSLVGKSLIFIFSGYPVLVDGQALKLVGDDTFELDMLKLDALRKYLEARNYVDLSDLGVALHPDDPDRVGIQELMQASILEKWFTISQTFAAVVDCPELYVERLYVRRTALPSEYITQVPANLPLRLETGRLPSYIFTGSSDGYYQLSIFSNTVSAHQYLEQDRYGADHTNGASYAADPKKYAMAELFEVGRDV